MILIWWVCLERRGKAVLVHFSESFLRELGEFAIVRFAVMFKLHDELPIDVSCELRIAGAFGIRSQR